MDVAEALGISRAAAYTLVQSESFPHMRIGKRILVPKDADCGADRERWFPPVRPPDRLCREIERITTRYTATNIGGKLRPEVKAFGCLIQQQKQKGNLAQKLGLFGGATRYEKLAGIITTGRAGGLHRPP